jgi:membrane fusion protein (multidrug efflux system)
MPSNHRRSWVFVFVLAGLVGLAYFAYNMFRAPGGAQSPTAVNARPGGGSGGFSLPVETAQVQAVELALDASAVGSLRSNESVLLRPEISGRIATIGFKDGSVVGKGTLLVGLDASMPLAELAQAKANLGLAMANQQRNQDLFEKKFISRQSLETSEAALKIQEAAVTLAQAKLDKMRLTAPFSGVVGIRNVSVGDYVKEGQDLINLEDISVLKIDFRLPESTFAQLKPGQRVEVSSDVLPGQMFEAVLDAVNPLVEAGGRSIACRAHLSNANALLRPGMFVRVRLIFEKRSDVLLIPEQALVPDGKAPYVFRVVDGQAMRAPVRTGVRRDGQVEVVDGLSAGDEIVTAGQLKLRDGAPVKSISSINQSAPEAKPAEADTKTGAAKVGA